MWSISKCKSDESGEQAQTVFLKTAGFGLMTWVGSGVLCRKAAKLKHVERGILEKLILSRMLQGKSCSYWNT